VVWREAGILGVVGSDGGKAWGIGIVDLWVRCDIGQVLALSRWGRRILR